MTQRRPEPPWITQKRQTQRVINFAILVGILSLLGIFIYLMGQHPAKASLRPQWDGQAGTANHACYHDGGVQQIAMAGVVPIVYVCKDGWAMEDETR